jgi:fatty acid desaturase
MRAGSIAETAGSETPRRPTAVARGSAIDRQAAIDAFSVKEAQAIVRHLFPRRPALYFADLAATMLIVYLTAFVYLSPGVSALQIAAGAVCGCALFRAGMFIHEIQHMRRGEMPGFIIAWNLVYGIPMLLPSFMYANHRDHHDQRTFGTERDGEYRIYTTRALAQVAEHFLVPLVAPLALVLRFLVLGPVSLLCPPLRRWVLENATTMGQFGKAQRFSPDDNHALWAIMELAAFAVIVAAIALLATGLMPWSVVAKGYVLGVLAIELNAMRDFTAHRFASVGRPMTHAQQLADSNNNVGRSLANHLLYPIGMRYHALHHLFPALPYHSMGAAHRLLMERLPPGSIYRDTCRSGFLETAGDLVRRAMAQSREAGAAKVTPAE